MIVTEADEVTDPIQDEHFNIVGAEGFLKAGEEFTNELPAMPEGDDLAGIIYTSGTTGRPKGVMLTHDNIVSNVKATLVCVSPNVGDTFLSFLPLSHTFERTTTYYLSLALGFVVSPTTALFCFWQTI